MDRPSLTLVVVVIAAIVIVVIVQAAVVVNLAGSPTSSTTASSQTSTGPIGIWDQYVKSSVGAIGAVVATLLAGVFAYRRLMKQLRTSTRNSFLDMLVGNEMYRNELNLFIGAVQDSNFKDMNERIQLPALHYLFILKPPSLKKRFESAIDKEDAGKIHALMRELFTD